MFFIDSEYKDLEKAEKYYLMAVEKEYSLAMTNLGVLYETEYKDLRASRKILLNGSGKR